MSARIKQITFLTLALMLLVSPAMPQPAFSQVQVASPAPQPKLTIAWIQFNSLTPDAYYNATVGLNLERGGNNPSVSFNLAISHVKTLNEVYAQLKSEVDKLGDELKKAAESFEPPSH